MTEKILNNNQVVVAGEIVSDFRFSHEIFGEGFYMVDLVVSRLSDAHDVIPLMVSDRLFDVEKSHIGEKVLAKGQFRSYNKHEENKNRLILSVFVREIEVIDAVDDKENKPNQIYLDGYICKEPIYRMTPLGRMDHTLVNTAGPTDSEGPKDPETPATPETPSGQDKPKSDNGTDAKTKTKTTTTAKSLANTGDQTFALVATAAAAGVTLVVIALIMLIKRRKNH